MQVPSDETSVFIVQPDGWYGILSLRAPFVRRSQLDGQVITPDWEDWLRRITGSGVMGRISCLESVACWHGSMFLNDPEPNDYAGQMLKVLAVNGDRPVFGTVAFTGFSMVDYADWGVSGLNQDQIGAVAAAYRQSQKHFIGK
jgi:hypothetical protein